MAIPIFMGFPWKLHCPVIFHSHAHLYAGPHKCVFHPQNAPYCTYLHLFSKNFSGVTPSDHELERDKPLPQTLLVGARPPCHIFRAYRYAPAMDVCKTAEDWWVIFVLLSTTNYKKKIKCQNKCDLGNNVSGGWWKCKPHDSTDEHFSMLFNMYAYEKKYRK